MTVQMVVRAVFFVRELACTVRVEGCAVTYSDFSKGAN